MVRRHSARRISVIVVSLNEGPNTARTVENLTTTLRQDSEIIVIDDGSTDGSADKATGDKRVRLIRTNGLGVAAARNHGASNASGDILIFVDAHMTVPRGWGKDLD